MCINEGLSREAETVAVAPVVQYTRPVETTARHSVNSDQVRTVVR